MPEAAASSEDTWRQLCIELRHLQSQLSVTALGEPLRLLEEAWNRGRAAALRSGFLVWLEAELLGEDLRGRSASLGWVRRIFEPRPRAHPGRPDPS